MLHPLKIDVGQFGVAGQHSSAIAAASGRGLPAFAPSVIAHDGTLVVVGSGPSLPTFTEAIRGERAVGRTVLAVNGAHDFLCEQAIIPDLFVTVDPRDIRHNLKHKNAQTVYLIASRAAPEVFEHLKDCRVMLWHSFGKEDEVEAAKGAGARLIIGGGSTSGLRAIALGYMLGFRRFVLYGFDSCNDAQGRKRFDSGVGGLTTDVIVGGRTFLCNMAMAAQANEFQNATYGWLPDIHIEAKGDGLIAAIIAERKQRGMPT